MINMKQIITVLAILISGIASAQTELYTVSRCGGNAVPRYISINSQDYVLVGNYVDVVNAASGLVCLSSNGNVNRNWMDYFVNYLGAEIEDNTSHNWYRITFPGITNGAGRALEIQRRTGGRYNVISRLRDNRIGYWDLGNNALEAAEYAFRR